MRSPSILQSLSVDESVSRVWSTPTVGMCVCRTHGDMYVATGELLGSNASGHTASLTDLWHIERSWPIQVFTDSTLNMRLNNKLARREDRCDAGSGIRVCVLGSVPFCDKSRHSEPAKPCAASSHRFVIKHKSAGTRDLPAAPLRYSVFFCNPIPPQ